MSRETLEKSQPEDLFHQFTTEKGSWNLVRVFRVQDGRRGAWRADLDPQTLPDIRVVLAQQLGPGIFDLVLAKKGGNSMGGQCRVEIEADMRSPAAQMQAAGGPSTAMVPTNVYPGGQMPPWGMPPPWMMQPPGPSPEVAALKDMVVQMRAEMGAQKDAFTQSLLRDVLMERHKAGNVMLAEQKETFKQALELGRSIRGGGGGGKGNDDWGSPSAVIPLFDRAARVFEKWADKRVAQASGQQPQLEAAEPDRTDLVVNFAKASIRNKVQPRAAIDQLHAILGEKQFRDLIEAREQFVSYFLELEDVQPMLADAYATQWVREAVQYLDEKDPERKKEPATTTTTTTTTTATTTPQPDAVSPDEVIPPPPPNGAA